MAKPKTVGFIVTEYSDDGMIEQILALRTGDNLPEKGVLDWGRPGYLFATKTEARDAIRRTGHYAKAFGAESSQFPDARDCRVVRIEGGG